MYSLLFHVRDLDINFVFTIFDYGHYKSWMDDTGYAVSIDDYCCVTHFKRPDIRAGGVAIYERSGATTMATPHLLMGINHVEFANLYARADNIGDVCAAEVMVDGVRTLLVSVYVNPNTSTDNIEYSTI
jgi:hypothetical protein